MRRILTVALLLLVLLPQSLMAANEDPASMVRSALMDPETLSKVPFPFQEYQYQKALFYYFTEDRLSLSELGADFLKNSPKEKDRMLLLLRLSDINLLPGKEYPPLSSQLSDQDSPYLTRLLDITYNMRKYEDSLAISKLSSNKGIANYFEGMSQLRLNKLKEATTALTRIPANDSFYPYARIALAQIEIMRQNPPDAEKYLTELLTHPAGKSGPLADKIHLLLGQLYFEKRSFSAAVEEFSKVSSKNHSREAQVGKAWSLIKLGNYEKAISVLKEVPLTTPYDSSEWEIEIIIGYCHLKTGKTDKGIDHYQELLNTFVLTEERVEQIIKDDAIRRRYRSILLKEEPLELADEEHHYLSTLQNDPVITSYLNQYEQLRALKTAFLRKEREAEGTEIELENKIKMGETMLKDMDRLVVRPKGILTATNTVIEQRYKMPFFNVSLFSKRIYGHWKQVLKKDPTPETKWLVDLILQEFMEEETLQCLDIPILCHLVSFFGDRKVTETPEQVREIVEVLDILAKDMKSVSRGGKIKFEVLAAKIREKDNSLNKAREALKGLAIIRGELKKNLLEIEKGTEKCLSGLDRRITERFMKVRYELSDFREGIIAGLNLAVDVK